MSDLVECRICGHRAVTLAKHFKPAHGLTCGEYRLLHPGALIRGDDHPFQPRLKEAPRLRGRGRRFEGLQLDDDGNVIVEGLVEGYHYIHCAVCGAVAEDLHPHVAMAHPELVGCYEEVFPGEPLWSRHLEMLAQRSLKGRKLSAETKAKMSANAGRWNKGYTKETDPRMAAISEKRKGQPSWSKGLTKADHLSLQSTSAKLSVRKKGVPNDAARLDLSMVDFTPYLDETGAVDRKTMAEELGISEPTVTKYMESIGLRLSTKYVDARVAADVESGRFLRMNQIAVERTTIRLSLDDLAPYRLANGKVVVARAMRGLGHVATVIRRECERLGVPTYGRIQQTLCLDAVSAFLGGVPYQKEWQSSQFVNPKTGYRFKFDGFFPSHHLLVEFHGYQHWVFPNVHHRTQEDFTVGLERDREKLEQVRGSDFKLLVLRADEPYTDPNFIRERFLDAVE